MAEHRGNLASIMWVLGVVFLVVIGVWALSIMGVIPLTFTVIKTPADLVGFLDSPRDDMQGIKVNGHFVEIGKRRSLQIVKGYGETMYLMRPYRQAKVRSRSLTRPELLDFCTNITGSGFRELRSQLESGSPVITEWEGIVQGKRIRIVKAAMFSYFITGLQERPVFMTQVELAKRLGMNESLILARLIPMQKRWYEEFVSSESLKAGYPVRYILPLRDELTAWLNEQTAKVGQEALNL
jgi:hypothetical protein